MPELIDELDELTAAYETACAAELKARGKTTHAEAIDAKQVAQDALIGARRYWREVGEAVGAFVDRADDGARVERVKVRNNTEGA